jgi:hypothetical protein
MSYYSEDPASVRVDFFTTYGKWKYTEAVKWTGEWKGDSLIHDQFIKSLKDHLGEEKPRLKGLRAICLEPYHEHSHPISVMVDW